MRGSTVLINTHPPFPCPTLHPKDLSSFSGSLPPPQWNQWHSYHHPRTSLHRERKEEGRRKEGGREEGREGGREGGREAGRKEGREKKERRGKKLTAS